MEKSGPHWLSDFYRYLKSLKTSKTKKTRRNGSKQYKNGNITNLNEQFEGLNFFRKYGTGGNNEELIASILKENPHPNIVKIYDISNNYITMEKVTTNLGKYDKAKLIAAAAAAKDHLQKLHIMYIDWKPDNMGIDASGNFKLFDFDASGISTADDKKWYKRPLPYWSFLQARLHNLSAPKEIDDFAFKINFIETNTYKPQNSSHLTLKNYYKNS